MSEKKDAYADKLKAQLDEWNADIDKLAVKAAPAEAEAKIEYQNQLDDLHAKRDNVREYCWLCNRMGRGHGRIS